MDAPETAREGTASRVDQFDVEAVNRRGRQKFYQARIKIFPKRAEGFYRRLKWIVMAVTLGDLLDHALDPLGPRPFAPDQAVLVDLANRRFYFFFIEIWPQEFYYVAGLLIMAGLGLFLVTSVVGPGLVRLHLPADGVDRPLHLGRAADRGRPQRPHEARQGAVDRRARSRKRAAVYLIWLLIGVATGGAWIFYFADAPTLLGQFVTGEAPAVAYITVGILTATTFVFAGFMREQVCTYMCPWPRIQGAMLDEDSLARHLQRLARRAALAASEEGASRGARRRRLRRLQCLRRGLPDGHRHPRRRPARMHHLRLLHRRLRRRDGRSSAGRRG